MKAIKPSSPYHAAQEPRRFKGINRIGLYTLMEREISRFLSVSLQTLAAPMVTTLLYYAIFALAFGRGDRLVGEVPFLQFLAPGLIMMTMVQNAFTNTSSSLMLSKFQGNIVDVLMPPLSSFELFLGFITGGIVRGLAVGLVTGLTLSFFVTFDIHSWLVILAYALLGTMMLSTLGLATGINAEKYDHVAAVTNFVVTPLTFLSGTFYSIDVLPGIWRSLAFYNPFFYMIDGFRAGFIGQADSPVYLGLIVLTGANIALSALVLWMLESGYKLKS